MLTQKSTYGRANFAFTDRWGGVSAAPFDQLNLAHHVGDNQESVVENRALLAGFLGVNIANLRFMNQIHSADVAVIEESNESPTADALVTTRPGVALVVLVADCVPVLLADPQQGVIGAVHAGRRGFAAGIVEAAVSAMHDVGARDVVARVGPAICGRCYEVDEQMRDDICADHPAAWSETTRSTPALDLRAGIGAQLNALGVATETTPTCTYEDDSLFSYRRSSRTGRFAGVVWT